MHVTAISFIAHFINLQHYIISGDFRETKWLKDLYAIFCTRLLGEIVLPNPTEIIKEGNLGHFGSHYV